MQPYAAYNTGQLITVAIENLLGRYFANRIANGLGERQRTHSEEDAREEVDAAIADYCAQRPDRATITLCTSARDR
jgi:hypothetical protein